MLEEFIQDFFAFGLAGWGQQECSTERKIGRPIYRRVALFPTRDRLIRDPKHPCEFRLRQVHLLAQKPYLLRRERLLAKDYVEPNRLPGAVQAMDRNVLFAVYGLAIETIELEDDCPGRIGDSEAARSREPLPW
jgi:hypothetical protein